MELTRDEILKMEAGPEMDTLIVKMAMGGFVNSPNIWTDESTLLFYEHEKDGVLVGYPYRIDFLDELAEDRYSHRWEKFRPSIDIRAAFLVVEKLREMNAWISISVTPSALTWDVRGVIDEAKPTEKRFIAHHKHLPVAIGRAALLAVMEK